jgi:hypothetical protein
VESDPLREGDLLRVMAIAQHMILTSPLREFS